MKNVPEKIYLQIDADGETPSDFNELHGVSWCDDKINDNDIEYILADYGKAKKKDLLIDFFRWYYNNDKDDMWKMKRAINQFLKIN